jgi:thymidine phosphorylase
LVKVGERVEAGQSLCVVHANDDDAWAEAEVRLRDAIRVGEVAPVVGPLVAERL